MQPGKCKYKYRLPQKGKTCPNPPLEGDTLCLFHSQNDKKDVTTFWNGIQDKLKKNDFDFEGYYFPTGCEADFFNKELVGANFSWAIFRGNALFTGAKFSGENTDFSGAEFSGENTDFSGAKFSGKNTYFSGAEFSGENTDFIWAEFSGENTYFSVAKFSGENTDFIWAEFSGENTYFSVAKFSGENTYFIWAKFSGEMEFHMVSLGSCLFYDTDLRKVKFIGCEFARQGGYRPFHWLMEKLPQKLPGLFSKDLSQSKSNTPCHSERSEESPSSPPFLKGDVGGLEILRSLRSLRMTIFGRFSEVFSRIDEKISSLTSRTDVLRDEIEADGEGNAPERYALIARSYQQLKGYFQDEERDYARAGEFYYGEMECKRKAGLYWPFLHLYWALSGYGERYLRALGWLLFYIFTLFPLLYYWKADPSYETPFNYGKFPECILHSLNVVALRFQETEIKQGFWFRLFSTTELILGVIQSALFFMALRSKLRR